MESTYQRSLLKGISWELFSFIITTALIYLVYENLQFSARLSLALSITKVFFFFIHERLWKKITWGKIHTPLPAKNLKLKKLTNP